MDNCSILNGISLSKLYRLNRGEYKMKYKIHNIVLLYDNRQVYIEECDVKNNEYKVVEVNDSKEIFTIKESDISCLILSV